MSKVEIDEVLCLCKGVSQRDTNSARHHPHTMRNKTAEVPPNDAVPCSALPAVELGWC